MDLIAVGSLFLRDLQRFSQMCGIQKTIQMWRQRENDRSSSVLMADGAGHGDFFWNPQYQQRDAAVSRFVRTGDGSIVAVLFSCAPERRCQQGCANR